MFGTHALVMYPETFVVSRWWVIQHGHYISKSLQIAHMVKAFNTEKGNLTLCPSWVLIVKLCSGGEDQVYIVTRLPLLQPLLWTRSSFGNVP